MKLTKFVVYFLISGILLAGSISAQGKVEGNTVRIIGSTYLGSLKTDLERRGFFSDLGKTELNQPWENNGGFTLFNQIGADYYHSLNAGILKNVFGGFHINRFGRGYEWNSLYPTGLGLKEGDYGFAYTDINLGVTISPVEKFRILPKYVIRSIGQQLDGSYLGFGSPFRVGQETTSNFGTSGLLGVALEFDINDRVTVYTDLLFLGPLLIKTTGEYKSEKITVGSDNNAILNYASGGYSFSTQKISIGGSYLLTPKLRLFASLENEKMTTKAESPVAFSVSSNGLSTTGTLLEYVSATNAESITIAGLKFGVTYDINLSRN